MEQTGDWEGLQVLPLYLIRQAYVRAMVTSFLLDDPSVSSEEKEKAGGKLLKNITTWLGNTHATAPR